MNRRTDQAEESESGGLALPAGGRTSFLEGADGTRIRFILWSQGQNDRWAGIVLLPGRSEFIEKYSETIADLLGRGYWLAAMDWRGQGLSGRPLSNRDKHHLDSFDPMVDDLARFFDLLEAEGPSRPRLIVAHSMGAHIALRFLHDNPGRVDGAALLAPMVALRYAPFGPRFTRLLTRFAIACGRGRSYAPGQADYGAFQRSRANMGILTSDRERFEREHRWIEKNRELALGGVTYGWLRAATRSIELINEPGYPEAIDTPLLVAEAGSDRLIDNRGLEAFAARLPDAEVLRIEGARHEILNERDLYRDRFFAAFDRWTGERIGA